MIPAPATATHPAPNDWSKAFRGIEIHPADTLLAERARDYLAGGPADAVSLVRNVCQQPATPALVAERMIAALLGDRAEFARCADGRWRLAHAPDPSAAVQVSPASPHEAAGPVPERVPTFDEWRAQRAAQQPAAERSRRRGRVSSETADAGLVEGPAPRSAPRAVVGPAPSDPLLELSYVVVDVETTGGSPQSGHRITEIAAVVVRDGEVRDVFETLVNPQRPIPPMIMKLTGITMEMVAGKQPFRDVCPQLLETLRGHVFVAHNVNFDWRFVTALVARASGHRLGGPPLCTVRPARVMSTSRGPSVCRSPG